MVRVILNQIRGMFKQFRFPILLLGYSVAKIAAYTKNLLYLEHAIAASFKMPLYTHSHYGSPLLVA